MIFILYCIGLMVSKSKIAYDPLTSNLMHIFICNTYIIARESFKVLYHGRSRSTNSKEEDTRGELGDVDDEIDMDSDSSLDNEILEEVARCRPTRDHRHLLPNTQ